MSTRDPLWGKVAERMSSRLSDAFRAHAAPAWIERAEVLDLEPLLAALLDSGRRVWSGVAIAPEVFVRHLVERLPDEGTLIEVLAAMATDDLYLACGCALGDPAALHHVERALLPRVSAFVGRIEPRRDFVDEVMQVVRTRLFVAEGTEAPRIAEYAGSGPLVTWLCTVGVRTARNLIRGNKRYVGLDSGERDALVTPDADPEASYLKDRYAREFNHAVRRTLDGLDPQERTMLSLYFLDGMTLAALGGVFKVHESTMARRIERCRARIVSETLALLRAELTLGAAELESLIGMVRSRIDLRLSQHLRTKTPK